MAFGERGTSRLTPFLVRGSRAVCLLKSINCHSRPRISPRLIPVSIANSITGSTLVFLVCEDALIRACSSSVVSRLSLAGLELGFLTMSAGFLSSVSPHSLIARFMQCLISTKSYWQAHQITEKTIRYKNPMGKGCWQPFHVQVIHSQQCWPGC